jgi:5-methylcytosine-specific restriction endonuclease McrA
MTVGELALYKRGGAKALAAEAERQLAARSARSKRVAPKRAASVERKAASRMERAEAAYALRTACEKRAGGKCETCGNEASADYPLHMHHLLPGRGRRRQEQAVENCVMACMWCHEFAHGGRILYVGPGLLAWAERHGYREARDNVRRRMDKALLADPTWPRDEDETARLGPSQHPSHPAPERQETR